LLQRIYGFEQESDLSRRLEGYFNQWWFDISKPYETQNE
jgi:hypothetical protein